MPKLIFTLQNGEEDRFHLPLHFDSLTIGRIPEGNHIVIEDRSLSKKHVMLKRKVGKIELIDLHSTNGTYENGTNITLTYLEHDHNYALGDVLLHVEFTPEELHELMQEEQDPTTLLL